MFREQASEGLKQVLYGGTIAFLFLAGFIILFLVIYRRKRNRHIREKTEMQFRYAQELLKAQLEIQEQTLKKISQEIHDNIGQALTLVKLNLNSLLAAQASDQHDRIINSKELVSKAIVDLRDLSRSLDTDYVQEMGLMRAIEYELELIKKTGVTDTLLELTGNIYRLSRQKELILFRIFQESVNNILKHASASKLCVRADFRPLELELQIEDNGCGIDLRPLSENPALGLGIRNMHDRANLIGGSFSMSNTLQQGTITRIIIPIKDNDEAKP